MRTVRCRKPDDLPFFLLDPLIRGLSLLRTADGRVLRMVRN